MGSLLPATGETSGPRGPRKARAWGGWGSFLGGGSPGGLGSVGRLGVLPGWGLPEKASRGEWTCGTLAFTSLFSFQNPLWGSGARTPPSRVVSHPQETLLWGKRGSQVQERSWWWFRTEGTHGACWLSRTRRTSRGRARRARNTVGSSLGWLGFAGPAGRGLGGGEGPPSLQGFSLLLWGHDHGGGQRELPRRHQPGRSPFLCSGTSRSSIEEVVFNYSVKKARGFHNSTPIG